MQHVGIALGSSQPSAVTVGSQDVPPESLSPRSKRRRMKQELIDDMRYILIITFVLFSCIHIKFAKVDCINCICTM